MITPVILCGGSGTRLWPLSRKGFPKQFAQILGKDTLFSSTARRLSGSNFNAPLIVTGSDFRFVVAEQLLGEQIDPGAILIEPCPLDSAPAVLVAALHLQAADPNAMMLVSPSDHAVADSEAFRAAIDAGVPAAEQGKIVIFGINPTRPETGYGWIKVDDQPKDVVEVKQFCEKPSETLAKEMLASGDYLWNAGLFLFKTSTIIAAFEKHAPNLISPIQAALDEAQSDLGFLRLASEPWSKVESISIDYAIMEKADNLCAVSYSGDWNDLGGWDSVAREMGTDDNGVAMSGEVTAIDCHDSLLRSDSEGIELVGIGVEDHIVVAMKDAVLVAPRSRAQEVKKAVSELKQKGARQAETFLHDHRPWGHFESIAMGHRFQVKRIVVKPGAALSLQSHMHRAEHWIVVSGTAQVTIDDKVQLLAENQSVYIPLGAKHRMENPGKLPMVLIEVQTGSYLGEDDIIRYEDVYSRGQVTDN
jgi:mannose-1-phosphate guanylyltransferase / mannose-6-phosphate isomerase